MPAPSGSSIGDRIERIFSLGLDAWADSQSGRRYTTNDPTPAIQPAPGVATPAGQGVGFSAIVANVPVWAWVLAGVGLVAALALRR